MTTALLECFTTLFLLTILIVAMQFAIFLVKYRDCFWYFKQTFAPTLFNKYKENYNLCSFSKMFKQKIHFLKLDNGKF